MAPSSRHLYPEWLRPRHPRGDTPTGKVHDQRDDGAWRVWQWLRAFDRRNATFVDLGPLEEPSLGAIVRDMLGSNKADERFVGHLARLATAPP